MEGLLDPGVFRIKSLRRLQAQCGHDTLLLGEVAIISKGKKKNVVVQVTNDQPLVCLDCFKRVMILCCNCGDSILMGNRIGIIQMKNHPLYAISTKDGFICCESCCDGKIVGYWLPINRIVKNFSFESMGVVPEKDIPVDPRFK